MNMQKNIIEMVTYDACEIQTRPGFCFVISALSWSAHMMFMLHMNSQMMCSENIGIIRMTL